MASGSSSKSSTPAPAAPAFQNSANFYGDQLASQTYMDPKYGVVTKYNVDPSQQAAKTAAEDRISQLIPTLGKTTAQDQQNYDAAGQAYADQQTAAFDRAYQPSLRNLREDIGSRFGTLQASPYFDQLNDLEKNVRTPALLDIANTATQKKQDLYNQQEQNKLNELQGLGYQLNNGQTQFLQNLQNPQGVSQNTNQFNLGNYQSQLQNYQFNKTLANTQQQQSNANTLGYVKAGAGLVGAFA